MTNPTPTSASSSVPLKYFVIVVLLLGLGIGGYVFGSNKSAAALADYQKKFATYQDSVVKPTLAYSDSVKQAIKDSAAKINALKTDNEKTKLNLALMKKDDSTVHYQNEQLALTLMNIAPDTCKQYIDSLQVHHQIEILGLHQIIDSTAKLHGTDTVQINTLQGTLGLSNRRADSLEDALTKVPHPPKPTKVLGITLPHISPGIAFLGGVGTTLGVKLLIK